MCMGWNRRFRYRCSRQDCENLAAWPVAVDVRNMEGDLHPQTQGECNSGRLFDLWRTVRVLHSHTHVYLFNVLIRYRLAVGLETGEIVIYVAKSPALNEWAVELKLDNRQVVLLVMVIQSYRLTASLGALCGCLCGLVNRLAHVDQVHRLAWRPRTKESETGKYDLASCSEDRSIRVLRLRLG